MRLVRAALVLSTVVLLSACDLVTEPEGPTPEDFAEHTDTAEVAAGARGDDAERDMLDPIPAGRLPARLERVAD